MGEDDVRRLLGDPTIVRHRGKIEATIANARASLDVIDEWGTLGALVWSFEPEETPPLLDHGVRLHGGDGAGQRPRRRLRHPGRGGRGAGGVPPTGTSAMTGAAAGV
jgi:hypothetical protein